MKSSFARGVVLATAIALPVSGLGATMSAANAVAPTNTSTGASSAAPSASGAVVVTPRASTKKAKRQVASLRAPARKGTKKYSKWYAKSYQKARYGWGKKQHRALVKLWNHESGWSHRAQNRSSGAYGIPQSLPGSKMKSQGSDWRTNPETQIRWGLGYIKGRYGKPVKALNHFKARNWY